MRGLKCVKLNLANVPQPIGEVKAQITLWVPNPCPQFCRRERWGTNWLKVMQRKSWANAIPLWTLSTTSCCVSEVLDPDAQSVNPEPSPNITLYERILKGFYSHSLLFACIYMNRSGSTQDLDLILGQSWSAGLTSFWTDRLRNKEASSRPWGIRSFTAKMWSPWKNKHPRCGGPCHWATLQWNTAFNTSVRLCSQDTDWGSLITITSFFSYVTPRLK